MNADHKWIWDKTGDSRYILGMEDAYVVMMTPTGVVVLGPYADALTAEKDVLARREAEQSESPKSGWFLAQRRHLEALKREIDVLLARAHG